MSKKITDVFDKIVDFDNLMDACKKVRKSANKYTKDALEFDKDFGQNIKALRKSLIDGTYEFGKYKAFYKDNTPVYNDDNPKQYTFSGKRVKRGLYKTADGNLLNADVNCALNILSKSKVVDLTVLYSRGELDTLIRIRVA